MREQQARALNGVVGAAAGLFDFLEQGRIVLIALALTHLADLGT